jgi:outer membrane protein TolC
MSYVHLHLSAFSTLLLSGCVLAPKGLDDERDALAQQGKAWSEPFEERVLPELADPPTSRDLLERAFLANGELEARYFEWKSALEEVSIAAGWPDTNLAPSFSYMVSGGQAKAWDRTTVNIGFDPMKNLSLPSKVRKAGELALENAREAGSRFAAAKFGLQRKVLDDWLKLALLEERIRIQAERLRLAKLAFESAAQRAALKGAQRDFLRAQVEERNAELELTGLETQARAARAQLNGILARAPDAELALPPSIPAARPVPVDDADLLQAGVVNNPELRALGFVARARQDALELARMQYLPDFNPFVGFTGSIEQTIGVGISLPTRLPQIKAGIEQARAMLSGAQASLRQARHDRLSSFVAALYVLRYSERQAAFLTAEVLPAAQQVLESAQQAHATGAASFQDLIEAQGALLDVRLSIAEARIEREQRLAEIEELAGFDIETVGTAGTRPTAVLESPEVSHHE